MKFPEVRGRPWQLIDWLVTRGLTRRMDGNDSLKRKKEWFANIANIEGIEVVLERRVQEHNFLREQNYKLLRELKKGGKLWRAW